jgi:uncharacterized protein involved in exopolysaccharide biosynthesis
VARASSNYLHRQQASFANLTCLMPHDGVTLHRSPDVETDASAFYRIGAALLRARYDIVRVALLFAIVTGGWMVTRPRSYISSTAILPNSTPGMKSGLAAITAQLGVNVPGGDPTQSPAFYVELLHTRELLRGLADTIYVADAGEPPFRGTLVDFLVPPHATLPMRRETAIRILSAQLQASTNPKTGTVRFSVSTRSPSISRQVCERAIASLIAFNQGRRQSQAHAERQFVEQRLRESRAELNRAEDRLAAFLEQNKAFPNSAVLRLQEDRLRSDMTAKQQVYTSLLEGFEQARIEEVRDTPTLTVLEAPETPLRPAPRGVVNATFVAAIVGALFGLFIGLVRDFRRRTANGPSDTAGFNELWRSSVSDLRHPFRTASRLARMRSG